MEGHIGQTKEAWKAEMGSVLKVAKTCLCMCVAERLREEEGPSLCTYASTRSFKMKMGFSCMYVCVAVHVCLL